MAEAAVRAAVATSCPAGVAELAEYLADCAAEALAEDGGSSDFREALEGSLSPFLDEYGVSVAEASAFFDQVAQAVRSQASASDAPGMGAPASDVDLLCRLPDLLMMYGGSKQPLLKNATLELVKGHRYGVVGSNGTGKSTLMGRIATGDIAGFPQHIRVVHLSHDTISRGITPGMTVRGYAQLRGVTGGAAALDGALQSSLRDVGFEEDMLGQEVETLSGGWQMRLALACAVAQSANLLLLDEPTNHLDAAAVQWLVGFMRETCVGGAAGATAMIVSHDAAFLDQVCTDVIRFTTDARLTYHPGNFSCFTAAEFGGDLAKAGALLELRPNSADTGGMPGAEGVRMLFPTPERVGMTTAARKAPVLTLQGVSFQYDGAQGPALRDVSLSLTMDSRVGILGGNGAGKSTLLAILAGRAKPTAGERWCNKHVRVAYIAQQHLVHLGEFLGSTPSEYIQSRYMHGYDVEAPQREARALTDAEEADRKRLGIMFGKRSKPVQALLGRREQLRHAPTSGPSGAGPRQYQYQVRWEGLPDAEMTWEGRGKIAQCGCEAMVDDLDERLFEAWAGVEQRPLTTEEVVDHLASFGLPEEVARNRKISMLSGGQKVKLMFAAALWTRAHVLCLDEPTNYLDSESVGLLAGALQAFKGGFAVVTHCEAFAAEVCTERWTVADGSVSGAKGARLQTQAKTKGRAGK